MSDPYSDIEYPKIIEWLRNLSDGIHAPHDLEKAMAFKTMYVFLKMRFTIADEMAKSSAYPRLGKPSPLSDLEKEMSVGYVEETCGWCGTHLILPEPQIVPGRLACLNGCGLYAGDYFKMQHGIRMAYAEMKARESRG